MIKEIKVDKEFIQEMSKYRDVPDDVRQKGLIYAGSKNINLFSEKMIGLKPYSWQVYILKDVQEAILDRKGQIEKIQSEDVVIDGEELRKFTITIDNEEFIILTSRQIGKSTLLALLSLWVCTYNHIPATLGNNTSVIIVSAGDTQAKKLLNEVNRMIRLGDATMSSYKDTSGNTVFGEHFFSDLLDPDEANNKQQISFMPYKTKHGELLLKGSKLGSTIKSYPPTSIVLGETASLVIEDEAGKTEKMTDEFHKEYLYPTGGSTNALRLYTSTPWVTSGFFYKLCDPDDLFEHKDTEITYCFTIDAIRLENPTQYDAVMRDIHIEEANGNIEYVQRAYYCRFVKGQRNYFDPDKVLNVFHDYPILDKYSGMCDMGVDFGGQTSSRTVITISKYDEEKDEIMRIYHRTYSVGQDNNLIEDIEEMLTRFNIQRIIPDDCPQGDYLIREMREKGWNIHPMNFRSDKVKKYSAFRAALGKIKSYKDDDLQTEMLALEQSEGSTQSKIMHAPGYSDDHIDSFVMSCYFFIQEDDSFKVFDYNLDARNEEDKGEGYLDIYWDEV